MSQNNSADACCSRCEDPRFNPESNCSRCAVLFADEATDCMECVAGAVHFSFHGSQLCRPYNLVWQGRIMSIVLAIIYVFVFGAFFYFMEIYLPHQALRDGTAP